MWPIEVPLVWAEQTDGHLASTETVRVDGAGIYTEAIVWAVVIVGVVELIKRMWLLRTGCRTERYQRLVAVLPVVVGTLSAPVFGPATLEAFGLIFTPREAIWFGPGAGAAAGWGYSLVKHTIAPMIPAALRETFVAFARRAGLAVDDTPNDHAR